MTIHHISNDRTTTLHADQAGDTWIVDKAGSIITQNTGIDAAGAVANRTIAVGGEVYGLDVGIDFGAANGNGGGEIVIYKTGLVHSGNTAIFSRGNGQAITNNGTINGTEGIYSRGNNTVIANNGLLEVSNTGIAIETGTAKVFNTGTIIAEGGIWAPSYDNGGSSHVVVFNSGSITGGKVGIELVSNGSHAIRNTGIISGDIFFGDGNDLLKNTGDGRLKDGEIDMGDGKDSFVNSGKLQEDIDLGAGDDVADLRGGQASGVISGGTGDDIYIVNRQGAMLYEDNLGGTDTIKTAGSFSLQLGKFGEMEKLVATGTNDISLGGNGGANRLVGNIGDNHLNGAGGYDALVGGKGADFFVFETGNNKDVVMDFANTVDKIDVTGWAGIDSFLDLKAIMTVQGDDIAFTMGSDELILRDVSKSEMNAGDFLFA